jgi:GNAT superfamily N-acetyltransferase
VTEVVLKDKSEVEIRPVRPADKARLAEGFERLSETSRYRRFLSPMVRLTAKQLEYLTELDHHDHEALVAIDPSSRVGVGVARYVRAREDPGQAEAAVVVADEWQRRGVGTALLRHLAAHAREQGIERFTGLILSDNRAVRELLEGLGKLEQRHAGANTVEVSLQIPEDALGEQHERHLAGWVRAAARGQLESRLRALAERWRAGDR